MLNWRGKQFVEVMDVITFVVKFIVARALNNRQFQTLMDEVGNNYLSPTLQSNVC